MDDEKAREPVYYLESPSSPGMFSSIELSFIRSIINADPSPFLGVCRDVQRVCKPPQAAPDARLRKPSLISMREHLPLIGQIVYVHSVTYTLYVRYSRALIGQTSYECPVTYAKRHKRP